MMHVFRSLATKVAAGVFAVLMLIFMWTSVDWSQVTSGSRTVVGTVGGRDVQLALYQRAIQSATENRQRETGRALSAEEIEEVKNTVWRQIVAQFSMEREYESRHIGVTEDELFETILQSPPQQLVNEPEFQTDGRFDITKYQRWLRSSAATQVVPILEAQYTDEIRRSKLLRVVTGDVYVSDAGLWQSWKDGHEQVTVELTAILPRTAVPDSAVSVSQEEARTYYEAHRDDFKRPATAFLSYVNILRFPDASDTAAALARVLALRREIVAGAPFEEIATRESADSASAVHGGDLGEFGRGTMDPAFEKAAYSLPVGSVSAPVLSAFGYHLIKVEKRSGEKVRARHLLVPVEITGQHRDALDARADSLEALGAERLDPAAFDSGARTLGLKIGQVNPLQQGTRAQVGLKVVPDAGVWAFQAKPGETSRIVEVSYAYFLFRLDSIHPEGVPAFGEIETATESEARLEKKKAAARTIADDLLKRIAEGSTLSQASSALRLPHNEFGPFARTNPPLPNTRVVGTAFGTPEGKTSGLVVTDEGLYILRVIKHQAADSAEFVKQLDDFRVRQINLARQNRVRNYLQALEESAEVKDRRNDVFRTEAQASAQAAAKAAGRPRS